MFKVKVNSNWYEETYTVYAIKITDNKTKFLIFNNGKYWEWVNANDYVPIKEGE